LFENGSGVRVSYGASSALAKQIENGAPADVFISADLDWMDYVAERKLIKPDTRDEVFSAIGWCWLPTPTASSRSRSVRASARAGARRQPAGHG